MPTTQPCLNSPSLSIDLVLLKIHFQADLRDPDLEELTVAPEDMDAPDFSREHPRNTAKRRSVSFHHFPPLIVNGKQGSPAAVNKPNGGEVESTHLHPGSDGVRQNRARQPAAVTKVATVVPSSGFGDARQQQDLA
nr:hypothetical protein Iba_chr15bCG10270 [Ipomoea batatas]